MNPLRSRPSVRSLYLKSLKPWNAEGFFDNCVYRPIGFVLALASKRVGLAPNTVSLVSLFFGVAAAALIAAGSPRSVLAGALVFQVSLSFDCADGQLARMTKRYSRVGRVLDGLVDLLAIVAVYYASALVIARTGTVLDAALIVSAGFLAHLVSAVVYDGLQMRFAAALSGEYGDDEELRFADAMVGATRGFHRLVYSAYRLYCASQFESLRRAEHETRDIRLLPGFPYAFERANRPLLALWSFVGPSAHVFYFLVFAALGELRLYFIFDFGVLGAVFLTLLAAQALVDRWLRHRLRRKSIAA